MIKHALRQIWASPALLGILFLEFVLLFAITILFSLIPVTALWIAVTLLVAQLLLTLLIDAVFKSGFASMVKNAVQDGTTVLGEFMPGVRRHWRTFFAYFCVRAFLIVLLAVPFLVSTQAVPPVGSPPQLQPIHYAMLAIFIFGGAVISFFWLIWTGAIIVFQGAPAVEAMRRSIRFTHAHLWLTLKSLLVCGAAMLAAGILTSIVNLLYALVQPMQQVMQRDPGVLALGALADVVAFLLFAMALVFCVTYLFGVYRQATTSRPAARSPRRKARTSPA